MLLSSILLSLASIACANNAMMVGIIGHSMEDLDTMNWYKPEESTGGCRWYGTFPFCDGECPVGYQKIRESNGRESNWWLSKSKIPDDSFGRACSTVFGGFFKKRFCCTVDLSDCSWRGTWQNSGTAAPYHCSFVDDSTKCGSLECAINTFEERGSFTIEIKGSRCDVVNMFDTIGKATCGYIEWYKENEDGSKSPADSWYKMK